VSALRTSDIVSASIPEDFVAVLHVPALLSVATVAAILDCHRQTVYRRINAGLIPAVYENDRQMVRADDLRAYIDALERVGGAQPARRARRTSRSYGFLRE
jgi:AraC-like DNA-binding protein